MKRLAAITFAFMAISSLLACGCATPGLPRDGLPRADGPSAVADPTPAPLSPADSYNDYIIGRYSAETPNADRSCAFG